ncbi:MAG: PilZ domain-containing protein [Deltaproteobacteria bacterium]|jgi:hypothetical protein|nr:PilZ domain-containing protein [Deltaproteobacteria bacterium]MBW2535148.1 PilZ domain-containing protein [Deltaproteobacteria bacterium]
MSDNERRAHPRFRLWLPARIEGEDQPTRLAVGHDMSQKGSLLVTRQRLREGQQVRLFIRVPPGGDDEHEISATVVRVEANDADPEGLWPFRLALEFDDTYPQLEKLLRDHADLLEGVAESGDQPPST